MVLMLNLIYGQNPIVLALNMKILIDHGLCLALMVKRKERKKEKRI